MNTVGDGANESDERGGHRHVCVTIVMVSYFFNKNECNNCDILVPNRVLLFFGSVCGFFCDVWLVFEVASFCFHHMAWAKLVWHSAKCHIAEQQQ